MKYLVFYKRVYNGDTVGQGNCQWECEKPITDISQMEELSKAISDDIKAHTVFEIRASKVIIANLIKLI